MKLLLLYFGDRDYEIAEADDDWHAQRSVPVFWDDENDRPDVAKTLEQLYTSPQPGTLLDIRRVRLLLALSPIM